MQNQWQIIPTLIELQNQSFPVLQSTQIKQQRGRMKRSESSNEPMNNGYILPELSFLYTRCSVAVGCYWDFIFLWFTWLSMTSARPGQPAAKLWALWMLWLILHITATQTHINFMNTRSVKGIIPQKVWEDPWADTRDAIELLSASRIPWKTGEKAINWAKNHNSLSENHQGQKSQSFALNGIN